MEDWDAVFLDLEESAQQSADIDLDVSAFLDEPPEEGNLDAAAFLEDPLDEEQEVVQAANSSANAAPERKRGRPVGTTGTGRLRKHLKSSQAQLDEEHRASQPQPGSIEYARSFKKKDSRACAATSSEAIAVSEATTLMDAGSGMWMCLQDLPESLFAEVVTAARYSVERQTNQKRDETEVASILRFKSGAMMSDKALRAALKQDGHTNVANVAHFVTLAASASVVGGGSAWAACLRSLTQLVEAGKFRLLFAIEKYRYDETPLHVRVQRGPTRGALPAVGSSQEPSNHAKVRRSEILSCPWPLGAIPEPSWP